MSYWRNATAKAAAGRSTVIDFTRAPSSDNSLAPGVIATVSAGASLTYQIDVTGDDVSLSNYNPGTGNWNALDGMSGLTASANGTLSGAVTGLSINITNWASGSVTLSVVQK